MTQNIKQDGPLRSWTTQVIGMCIMSLVVSWTVGCSTQRKSALKLTPECGPCQTALQQIEYPDLQDEAGMGSEELMTGPPVTISNFHEQTSLELTVDQCVELALANSKVMQKLGGAVINAPAGATTLYDQAIRETNPSQSVEAALSAFDAQFNSGMFFNHSESPNVGATALFGSAKSDGAQFDMSLTKTSATGATFGLRSQVVYNRLGTANAFIPFRSDYDIVNTMEVRQPLLRGAGTAVNRIAGPNAIPGNYNGVLIARIRSDISLADFELAVRNLVRDVESNYWELYYAYRDLDTKLLARDAARETWENRKLRLESGVGRPDDEAQARQQYINFQQQAQNSLAGAANGQTGVLSSERNLRRLMGLTVNDGKLIRPISEPTTAPVSFDWNQSQVQATNRRVEIRRQKWTVRQRELELVAAKALNKWSLDLVGTYGFKGFGDNLFGSRSRQNGSAFDDLINGDLDDWNLGVEFGGAIGNRTGHLAVRNAELNLARERALLKEQERQILHDLGAAYTEVDRAFEIMKTSFNSLVAVQEELEPKKRRVDEGQDQVFFLLDAQQRTANAASAVHRAIATYNQSLLSYSLVSGDLLKRYNITLAEGPWNEEAQINASTKSSRFPKRGVNVDDVDNCPVSLGPLDQ